MSGWKLFLLLGAVVCLTQGKITFTPPQSQPNTVEVDLCGTCVAFADESIDILLNVILNKYIVGTCGDLCGYLPKELDKVICNVLCDYVGIRAFIEALEAADLDPVYYCELLGQCPVVNGGAGNITSITVTPTTGPVGTQLTINIEFTITQRTSTGTVSLNIQPPGPYESVGGDYLNEGYMPGNYQMNFDVDTKGAVDQNGDPWPTGAYAVEIDLCSGMCGSKHPHAFLLSSITSAFTLTERQ